MHAQIWSPPCSPQMIEKLEFIPQLHIDIVIAVELYLIPYIGWVWALVELGFFKGTDGPNRFGPDPRHRASKNSLGPLSAPRQVPEKDGPTTR